MIKQKYYDVKNGKLNAACQWQLAFNKNASRTAHHEARQYAAQFVEHPSIDPYEAYCKKFKELTNNQAGVIKPLYQQEVA